jgi:hypothetical protein
MVREMTGSGTTDTAYAVNAMSHRYDSVGDVPLIHDGEGNLLFDGRSYFLYDFKNRLSEVWQFVPADTDQALQASGSMARSSSGSREARYLVPRERLERIRNRARNTLMSAERMRRGYADVTGRMALANQESSTAAVEGNLALVAV